MSFRFFSPGMTHWATKKGLHPNQDYANPISECRSYK
jgi:hypothetical protein